MVLTALLVSSEHVICIKHTLEPTYRLSFGSCFNSKKLMHKDDPFDIFNAVKDTNPDIFVWLGDFVYLDNWKYSVKKMKRELKPTTLSEVKFKFLDSYNNNRKTP